MRQILLATYRLENNSKIKTIASLDTKATKYCFIDSSMMRYIFNNLLIEFIKLWKPKAIQGFHFKQAPDVTHTIDPTMTV